MNSAIPQSSWRIRRRVMFAVLAFCMGVIAFIAWSGQDSRVAETVVLCGFGLIGLIVSVYVLGAAWEDIEKLKIGGLNGR